MATSERLRFAGDVNIEKLELKSVNGFYQDISNQVIGIQIFEDIFAPFITGTLIIKDSLDLLNVFPLTGEEYLSIRITTPTLPRGAIQGDFYVFKMTNREILGDRAIVYELHFITQEAVIDMNKRISKKFEGKPSEIAKIILTDKDVGLQLTKAVNIEESSNKIKYISNFWSPVRNMTYLCDHAYNTKESPSYVFFENRAGYNFVTLDSLYDNSDYIEYFTYDKFVRDTTNSGDDARNIVEEYKRISRIAVPTAFDYMERLDGGMIGSKQYSFDLTSKNVDIKEYDMFEDWEKNNHTNLYPLASNKSIYRYNAKILNRYRHWGNFNGGNDSSNSNYLQKRMSIMKMIDAAKIEITVPGRTQYTVGQKVLVELDKMEPAQKKDSDTLDSVLSGAYIIGAINHFIDREKHECVMELFKDSLLKDINKAK
jgi:hypothetical protein